MGRNKPSGHSPAGTADMPHFGKLWPVWGVLVACVWFAFSPVLSNGFVDWDDPLCILENHAFPRSGLGTDPVRLHDVHWRRLHAGRLVDPESHLRDASASTRGAITWSASSSTP